MESGHSTLTAHSGSGVEDKFTHTISVVYAMTLYNHI